MKKICSDCKTEKSVDEFGWRVKNKGCRRSYCKSCDRERSIKYYRKNKKKVNERQKQWYRDMTPLERSIYVMARGINIRTREGGVYAAKGIKNELGDYGQIRDFLYQHHAADIQRLLDAGLTPSVDRIDPAGHYETSNIRVISHQENSRLGSESANKKTAKPIELTYKDGTNFTFDSVTECARSFGVAPPSIRRWLNLGSCHSRGIVSAKHLDA